MTVKGNQGTPFLQETDKLYYSSKKEVMLESESSISSTAVRTLARDEVVEFLEGPKKEVRPEVLRAKIKAAKDNAIGWIAMTGLDGKSVASVAETLVVKSSVAMTDGQ